METLKLEFVDGISTIYLDRGKANPINHTMVKELRQILKDYSSIEEVKGVILSGKENFFSAGLDLPELYNYDKDQFQQFWVDFLQMIIDFILFEKPVIANITGHSPAGGTVMALGCDYKIMAAGNYKIGLNEIPVGIIVPQIIFEGYAFHLGRNRAYNYLMEGKLYLPDEAKEVGLVNEVAIPDKTYERAIEVMRKYLSFDQNAWIATKKNTKIASLLPFTTMKEEEMQPLLDHWWLPSTREIMAGFIAGFSKK